MAKLGTVVAITGTAFVQTADGQQKLLKLGDTVQVGDTIITAHGVTVELEVVNGKNVIIADDQVTKLTDEVGNVVQADIADSAIDQTTINAVIKAIEEGRDINDVLEETAAGLTGGSSTSYGFSFVNLLRVVEGFDPFNFQFEHATGVSNDFQPFRTGDDLSLIETDNSSVFHPNSAPVGIPASIGAAEDAPMLTGTLSATDPDGDPLTFSIVGATPPGLTINSDGTYSFDYSDNAYQHLKQGEVEVINVPWEVSDGKGGTAGAILTITVTGTNDAPVAVAAIVPVTEDTAVTFNPINTSVTDVDGDSLTIIEIAGQPIAVGTPVVLPEGVVTLNLDGSLTFTPNPDFNGPVNFSYTVNDGTASTSSNITVNVASINDAPIAVSDNVTTGENTTLSSSVPAATDIDGTIVSYSLVTGLGAGHGNLVFNADGTYSFNPGSDFDSLAAGDSQVVTFTYTATDNDGDVSTPATISITVTGTNDAPIAVADVNSAIEGGAVVNGTVATNDSDVDAGATLTYNLNAPVSGLILNSNGSYSFDPTNAAYNTLAAGATTNVVANYTVNDEFGASSTSTLTITVTGTNDAAVITGTTTGSVTEDTTLTSSGTLSINDPDSGESAFQPQTSVATTYGSFTINATGVWTYVLNNNAPAVQSLANGHSLNDSITVLSIDGTPTTIVVTINGTDESATIGVGAVQEDVTLSSTGTLTATGVATFVVDTIAGTYGSFNVAANGAWTYTLNNSAPAVQALAQGESHLESFTVTLSDGSTTAVNVTVSGTNDVAVIGTPTVSTVTEDISVSGGNLVATGSISISDVDTGQATFSTTVTPAGGNLGSLVLAANGTYTYTVANSAVQYLGAGVPKVDTFTITSADGTTKNVTFTINGTNDVAVIGTPTVSTVTEDISVSGGNLVATGSISISDVDTGQATFSTTVTPVGSNLGSLVLAANGSYTYTVANSAVQYLGAGSSKIDTFTVTSADGTTKNVSFTINGTNDTAVISGTNTATLTETNAAQSTGGTLTVTDVDTGEASFVAQTNVAGSNSYGNFSINAAGAWTYTMNSAHNEFIGGQPYTDSITVLTVDGTPRTITVTINGTNDLPVIGGTTTGSVTEDVGVSGGNLSAGGTLTITDADTGQSSFVAQTNVPGSNNYGTFSVNAAGVWTYTASNAQSAIQALGATQFITDSLTVTSADGTTSVITVTINGTNDVAVIGTPTVSTVTEDISVSGGNLVATGSISISDVDTGQATFSTTVTPVGSNLGSLVLAANGSYTYTVANSAVQYLGAGSSKIDTFTVTSADGTTKNVSFTINGTNDTAVISGTNTATLTETNAAQSTGGTLTVTDVDTGEASFVAQTNVAGSNSYGNFSINAAGAWTYTMNSAHNEFIGGQPYTDSITVLTVDGTPRTITVTINGTNDLPVIGGTTTGSVTEDTTLTSSGTLSINDPDSGESAFQPQTSVATTYGSFTINATGVWTYVLNNNAPAVQSLANGHSLNDSITVLSIDGTPTTIVVTINGTDESATIGVGAVQEDVTLSSTGTLTATGVATFVVDTIAGTYGSFNVAANGAWTYTLNNSAPAVQALAQGESHLESFTVTLSDGSTTAVNVTVSGTNDVAVIGTPTVSTVTEDISVSGGNLVATGSISISDVDTGQATFSTTVTPAGGNLGSLVLAANGTYTYTVANSAVQYLGAGVPKVDTFTITSADGTTKNVTFTINGTNDVAVIGTPTVSTVTEDISVSGGNLVATGSISISDVDTGQATFSTTVTPVGSNLGSLVLAANGSYTYTVANSAVQYLGAGSSKIDTFTVTSADGTTKNVSFTINGTNDTAVISGTNTATLTETNAAQSTGGTLTVTDVDTGEASFVAQTNVAGSNSYGNFSINAAGAWTYTMNSAHNEFIGGQPYTDSITVLTVDGTPRTITVTINGTNDLPVIGGTTTGSVTEDVGVSGGNLSAGGTLTITDADTGQSSFVAQTNVPGSNNYGTFSVNAAGVWTYTASNAQSAIQALGATQFITDSLTVTSADGTTSVITVTINGTNDVAVIGTPTVSTVTEDISVSGGNLVATGSISISDVDTGQATFSTTVTPAGGNLGSLVLAANGTYTYTVANSAVQYLGAGVPKVDTFTITSADGTTKNVTFTINGTNDVAVIGTPTVSTVTEDISVSGGNLVATGSISISDVDTGQATFSTTVTPVGSNLGSLVLAANGSYTYTVANSAVQYLGAGSSKIDTFTVTSADGTTKNVSFTINGTNDTAVISGTNTATLTETNAAQSTGGTLTVTDVDTGEASFVAQTNVAGSNSYGNFSINAAGAWTYTMNSAHNEFIGGQPYTDSITVLTVDGTPRTITVTINGTNDLPVIGGTTTGSVTEDVGVSGGNLSAGGTLTITDADTGQSSFVAQTNVPGSNNYGTFSVNAAGVWTYTASNAQSAIQALGATQFITDSLTVTSADGTTSVITVTINGTNDVAVIGTPTVSTVTEDISVSGGNLVATGSISISDVDTGQATFSTTVTPAGGNLGSLVLAANGTYTYTVANSAVQYLGAGVPKVDTFTITSADGTTKNVTFTINGTNDVAVIGTPTVSTVTEDISVSGGNLVATGSISISDVDTGQATFSTTVTPVGSNLGSLVLAANGSYTYTVANSAVQYLGAGSSKIDTFTVTSADGTTKNVSFTINGTNDTAVISGTNTATLTETNAAQSTGGTLTVTDVDTGEASFVAQTNVAGSNSYGNFSINAAGAWTYTMNSAHNEFIGGQPYTDSITVLTVDGTPRTITVTINGTNDLPVIGGTTTGSVTEDTTLTSSGTLSINDPDSGESAFQPQTSVATTYGSFTINATGVWTYVLNNNAPAVQSLANGHSLNDSITVLSIDGTPTTIVVTINGTDESATIGVGAVQEDVTLSSTGTLTATGVATFVVDTIAGTYGSFNVAANGAWTYTLNNSAPAVQALAQGESHLESFTVTLSDGSTTAVNVTVSGTNDVAVIGTPTVSTVTEDISVSGGNLVATGSISISDVDTGQATFSTTVTPAGGNLGSLVLAANGTYTYTVANSAVQYLGAGVPKVDTFTITSADGTTKNVTFTINGTNDVAVIGTPTVSTVTEDISVSGGNLVATGSISISDVDTGQATFSTTVTPVGSNLGSLVLAANGSYTYTVANSAVQYLGAGSSKIDTFTVTSADGTTKNVSFTINGTNDTAVISGTNTATLTETNAAQSTGGTLTVTDVDTGEASFVAQTNVAGSNSYGNFSINAAGAWTYTMNSAHNEFIGGQPYTDSITVLTVDGTPRTITVTINGTNDLPVIGGTTTGSVTEDVGVSGGNLSAGGTLTITDADTGQSSFVAQTNVPGSNNYGTFSVNAAGVWTYTASNAQSAIQALGATQFITDSLTVTSADGTTSVITVTINGTNDVAVIGTPTVSTVTEDISVSGGNLVATGSISISDVDTGQATFSTTVTPAGGNLGSLVLAANGTYTYTVANSAVQYLGAGVPKVDTFTITSADGTTKNVTFTINGTNDVAVIGTPTVSTVTEDISVSGGNLVATGSISISDVDTGQATFSTTVTPVGSNLGSLVLAANGSYTYTVANSAVQYLGAGSSKIDTFTVTSADGTTKNVSFTINGTNDTAVISGTNTATLTETNAAQSTGGTLTVTDVDTGEASFVAQTNVAGSNSYGNFSINAAGAWTYTMNSAHNEFIGGQPYTDSITVLTVDGTPRTITVTINGTNDLPVIGGTTTGSVTEDVGVSGGNLSAGGTLTITDADTGQSSFVAQTNVPGSNNYGTFSVNAAGVWTYTASNAQSAIQALGATQFITDSLTVTSADGTTSVITVTINGTNDVAVIGTPTVSTVTEDISVSGGNLVATGSISISDVDTGQATFSTTVTPAGGNLGSLVLAANGTYTYTVANSAVQYLGAGVPKVDTFTITSADGTTKNVTFTINGTNDVAVIGTPTVSTVTEDISVSGGNLVATGSISISDVDTGQATFSTTVTPAGGNLGSLVLAANGTYTYTVANSAVQYLGAGVPKVDTFTITSADGTTKNVTFTINGTNDVAVIGTPTVSTVTEDISVSGGNLVATGSISISDVDTGQATFSTTVTPVGSNLGSLVLAANGSYTYTVANSAVQYLGAGSSKIDTFTVTSADGTTKNVSFTINGTNDTAVISGTNTATLTETNAAQSTGGTLTVTDVDTGEASFVAQTNVAGSNSYGNFSINAAGAWTYTMNSAHNEFIGGQPYTDSITVLTVDGTPRTITVTINGTNDLPVIGGTTTGSVTEDVGVSGGNLSAGGTLTITDADTGQSSFVAQTNVPGSNNYGTFSVNAAGVWTYTASNAQSAIQALGATQFITDSLTVTSADGTTSVITVTINGTNDVAVIGTPTVSTVTEDISVSGGNLVATGSISISDVDTGQATFSTTVTPAGGNLGSLVLAANGTYTYTVANSAVQYLGAGVPKVDTFTITSADGTTKNVTFTINGTNDVAVIGTPTVSTVTEDISVSGGNLVATGSISISDVDTGQATFSTTVTPVGSNLGSLVLAANGSYTYTVANSAVQYLGAGSSKIDTFTVTSADGTTKNVSFTINGTNDTAVISGTNTATLTETNAAQSTGGTLTVTDVDTGEASFVAQTNVAGSNSYGNFSINAAGAWTYTMNSAHNEFIGGQPYTDSITVLTVDGTPRTITVTINGTNDLPVIGGTTTGSVTEDVGVSGGNLSAGGTLTITDADTGQSSFVAQTNVPGSNNYGTFSVNAAGVWTYTASNAQSAIQALGATQFITDSLTVTSADGTTSVITVTINGTNDVAVIGTPTVSTVTEDISVSGGNLVATGSISISDVDTGQATFSTTVTPAGGNLGSLVLAANGTYTYTVANSAVQYLGAGVPKVDTFTITSADGTTSVITVTINGTNDVAVIGTPTVSTVTEDISVSGGNLVATGSISISDVDTGQATFSTTVTPAGGNLGSLVLAANGTYTYTVANSAVQYLGAGVPKVDTFTITSADGTTKNVTFTINGTNDVAVIGTPTVSTVTEDISVSGGNLVATGSISISDVDTGQATFSTTVTPVGSNLGSLVLAANGSYTYTVANSAVQYLGAGSSKIDTFTVTSADGTTKNVSFTINGTNDTAVISGTNTATLTETNAAQSTGGTLTVTDVDTGEASFVAQTNVAGSNSYGNFSINAAGAWTYTMNSAHNEFIGGQPYTDSITVLTVDGTPRTITVTINGTNDLPVIGGTTTGSVTEDVGVSGGNLSAGGTLTITDADTGQSSFVAQTNVPGSNNYGTFSVNAAGVWTYTASNAQSAIQALGATQFITDSLTVTSADGTTSVITVTINGTNDAPIASNDSYTVNEDGAAVPLNPLTGDSDPDGTTPTIASINGVTLTGSAQSIAVTGGTVNISAGGIITFTPAANFNGTVNFPYVITDGALTSTANQVITVNAINDAPVNTMPAANYTTTEDAPIKLSGLSVSDVDAGTNSITVSLSVGSGTITAANAGGVTVTGTGTGTIVLTGTLANINTYLSTVANQPTYTPVNDANGAVTLTMTTNDQGNTGSGGPLTDIDTKTINITAVADIANDSAITVKNSPVTINVLANDSFENAGRVITQINGANITDGGAAVAVTNGSVQLVSGSLVFTPATNFTGIPTFTYTVTSGGATETATVTVNVVGVTSVSASSATEGITESHLVTLSSVTTGSITLPFSVAGVSATSGADFSTSVTFTNGVTLAGGILTIPAGVTTFTINIPTINDNIYEPTETYSINVDGVAAIGTITDNDPVPTVTSISSPTVTEGADLVFTVTMSNPSSTAILHSFTVGGTAIGGTDYGVTPIFTNGVTLSGTDLIIPAGVTSFTITVPTVNDTLEEASETIIITAASGAIGTGTILDNDARPVLDLDANNSSGATGLNYTTTYIENAIGVSVADADINLTDTDSATMASATITLTNAKAGDVLSAGTLPAGITVNIAGNVVTLSGVSSLANYQAAIRAITFSTSSDNPDTTPRVINVVVNDGAYDSTTAITTINVTAVNDAAVISGTSTGSVTEASGVANAIAGTPTATGTLTDTDVDNPANTFTAVGSATASTGGYGTYTMTAGGVWTYTINNSNAAVQGLNAGGTLIDTFTVTSIDGTSKVITVTINGANDAAVISGTSIGTVVEAGGVANGTPGTPIATGTLTSADIDNPANTFTASSGTTTHGSYTMNAAGVWVFSLNNSNAAVQALNVGDSLTDTFTVSSADGTTKVVTVTINGTNDAPTAVVDTKTTLEDSTATGNVLTNDSDIDGGTLSVTQFVVGGTTYVAGAHATIAGVGDLTISSTGSYVFTPLANYGGSVPAATYTVSDGSATSTSTLNISVTPVADAPSLYVNGTIVTGGTTTTTTSLPPSSGLTMAVYTAIAAITPTNAVNTATVESGVETSTPTSVSIVSTTDIPDIPMDTAVRFTGYIYLTAGSTYVISGDRDDTIVMKLGGTSVFSSGFNTFGAFTAAGYTPAISGYYSFETIVYNGDGQGSLNLNMSVNGSTAVDLSSSNFNIYPDASAVAANSLSGEVVINDGGYYTMTPTGHGGSPIALGHISAVLNDADGSESLSLTISAIPVGAILTDGHGHSFTATAGNTSANVTTWDLNNLQITPPTTYTGTFSLNVTATSTESAGGAATSSATIPVTVTINTAPAGTDHTIAMIEDQAYTLNVSDFGFRDNGDTLQTVKITTLATGGTLYLNNVAVTTGTFISVADIAAGRLTYVPTANSTTSRSFTFQVQDSGGTTNGGVDLDPSANTITFNIATASDIADKGGSGDAYTAIFNAGNTSITDTGTSGTDTLTQSTTGTPTFSTFNFNRYSGNLEYTGVSGANAAHITFLNQYSGDAIEQMRFSTGGTYLGFSLLSNTYYNLGTGGAGGTGNDIIAGSSANDTLVGGGGTGQDIIFGNAGNDTITATGTGAHLLVGGIGDDTITGGTGADTYVFGMADGNDTITDTGGADRIVFDSNGSAITGLNFTDSNTALGGDLIITYNGQQITVSDHFIAANSIETVNFYGAIYDGYSLGSNPYTLSIDDNGPRTSSAGVNTILIGSSGNDTLTGNSGNDLLFGGDGDDVISSGTGSNLLVGGAGNDTMTGGTGNDVLVGGAGNDVMAGGGGVDVFKWELADKGTVGAPSNDRITDFDTTTNGDKLDLRDILTGENHTTGTGNLTDYLHFEKSGSDTIVHISDSGAYASGFNNASDVQTITLQNVDLVGSFTNDQQVIADLLSKQKLITD